MHMLEMSWEDWNESINKLDTRTKIVAEKDIDADYIQQMKTNLESTG